MKRSGTLTTPVTGLLIIVLLMGMEITKAQSFFRQTGIQLLTKQEGLSNNTLTEIHQDKDGFLWLGTDGRPEPIRWNTLPQLQFGKQRTIFHYRHL